jgi:hypothetical protein
LGENHRQIIESIISKIFDEVINNPELVERYTSRAIELLREEFPQIEDFQKEQTQNANPSLSTEIAEITGHPSVPAPAPAPSIMEDFGTGNSIGSLIQPLSSTEEYASPTSHMTPQVLGNLTDHPFTPQIQRGSLPPGRLNSSHSSRSRHLSHPSLASTSTQFPASSFTDFPNNLNSQSSSSSMSNFNNGQSTFSSQLESLNEANANDRVRNMYQFQGSGSYSNSGSYANYGYSAPLTQTGPLFENTTTSSRNGFSFDPPEGAWRQPAANLTMSEPLDTFNMLEYDFSPNSNIGGGNGEADQANEFYQTPRED